uniref:Uncharacterized protein n=1 Tax=Panagrolaimus sp. ES5 TaxID=591445 RepID=A0AC34GUN2_9BILA
MGEYDVQLDGKTLIKATPFNTAPFEESAVVNLYPTKSVLFFCTFPINKPSELVQEIKLSNFKSKKVKITLKLDINSFYDLKVEPFDESLQKTPICISFNEEKPIIGKAAIKIYAEKPKFVVFDLIKLCSISNPDIINPTWGFTLSKEDETIFVTMQTNEGERKSNTAFLMALILKNGKDTIKKETGKKMKGIEIKFDGFVPNEILKKNFVEAGKLLEKSIVFV